MAYSMDLRRRAARMLERGESAASVARRLEISERTVRNYRKRHEAGRLAPDKTGPQGPIKLTVEDHPTVLDAVAKRPDITLLELSQLMRVQVNPSTVFQAARKWGLSFKKSH
jgi:transposase